MNNKSAKRNRKHEQNISQNFALWQDIFDKVQHFCFGDLYFDDWRNILSSKRFCNQQKCRFREKVGKSPCKQKNSAYNGVTCAAPVGQNFLPFVQSPQSYWSMDKTLIRGFALCCPTAPCARNGWSACERDQNGFWRCCAERSGCTFEREIDDATSVLAFDAGYLAWDEWRWY